jgi:archaellum biogenesis protein FlaJ (TadC family)
MLVSFTTLIALGIFLLLFSVVYCIVGLLLLGVCYTVLGHDRFKHEVDLASQEHHLSKTTVILAVILTWPILLYTITKTFISRI